MEVRFYQVFVTKGGRTSIKLYETYVIPQKTKFLRDKKYGFTIIILNDNEHRKSARKNLIVSPSQFEQLRRAYEEKREKVTITELYTDSELREILKNWNPCSIRLFQAAYLSRAFCEIASHLMSNLGGEFIGKFLLPTPAQEKIDIEEALTKCKGCM